MNEIRVEKSNHWKLSIRRLLLIIIVITIILLFILLFLEYESITRDLFFEDVRINWLTIFFILVLIVLLISMFIVLSYKEYWEYFSYRRPINRGYHTLSIDALFENENRKNIIKAILAEPGIYNNELIRQCNLQKGQLQWHLQVLLQYKIVRKEKIGQYTAYFPSIKYEDSKSNTKLLRSWSKTNFKILDLIEENPGINPSMIAVNLNLNKSSVKYHVDKFIKEDVILHEKEGRLIRLYVKNERSNKKKI